MQLNLLGIALSELKDALVSHDIVSFSSNSFVVLQQLVNGNFRLYIIVQKSLHLDAKVLKNDMEHTRLLSQFHLDLVLHFNNSFLGVLLTEEY